MNKLSLLTSIALSFAFIGQAGATGYEKNIQWSGHYSGLAGVGENATGAESLYFNPAGLARGSAGQEFSFNISPTFPTSQGAITADNTSSTSDSSMLTPYSLFYNYNVNQDLGFGIGMYVGAGAKAVFDNVSYTGFSSYTKTENNISDQELSLGVGYQIIPGLRIGAAWRMLFVNAEVAGASVVPLAAVVKNAAATGKMLEYIDNSNLQDTETNAWRFGLQYAPEKTWGVGLEYRTAVPIAASGMTQATYEIVGATGPYVGANGKGNVSTNGNSTLTTTLPQQVALGGFYGLSDTWKLLGAAEWVQYSQNQQIHTNGTQIITPFAAKGPQPIPDIQQQWTDQYTYRLAAEYAGWSWPLRFGVVYQTTTENTVFANPAFWAPGNTYTVVVGTGHQVMDGMTIDGGLEYSTDTVSVSNADEVTGHNGSFSTNIYAAHVGLTYLF